MSIGIFDSGIGGMTVAKAVTDLLPNERIIYFGDTAHFPYGDKSQAAIQAYSIKVTDVLLQQGCKVILIACNSASSAAYDLIKAYVGSKAIVINVIDPIVAYISKHYINTQIGLIGTKRTVQSNIYKAKIDALDKQIDLHSLATPLLAPMIEEGFAGNQISQIIINEYLSNSILKDIKALILGCTHYPLIKSQIKEFYQEKVSVIDSSVVVAQHLHYILTHHKLESKTKDKPHHFYVSDYTKSFEDSTTIFFGKEIKLEPYKLWE